MRYLIIPPPNNDELTNPFYSGRFESDNHFVEGMKVFDLHTGHYTINGTAWIELQQDHF